MSDDAFAWQKAENELTEIDTSVPHSARIWNYWLGGKDNFPVDQAAGDQYAQTFPGILDLARLTRGFLKRSVRFLAREAGIRQFIDVGTGLPTIDNTHEVAQRIAPDARIVYVDNDPLVLAHAHALLTSTPQGTTDYIDTDMHRPDTILEAAARTLDLDRPVGLTFMGVLGHIADDGEARSIVTALMDGLAPGSHLAICDGYDVLSPELLQAQQDYDDGGSVPYKLRSREQLESFFTGLELLPPGLVPAPQWRPETEIISPAPQVQPLGGIAVKNR
ncbi:SAM-dependent methyltransferase [Actinomadura formosensis]|uniref:SAM-dependent methyltransferase n=1 Tax=Actinomadura formosensis TaxID=60706 RepID=UPI00082C19F9|nr:SAM-dependent methyltransferase [Actinomadura formosensis]